MSNWKHRSCTTEHKIGHFSKHTGELTDHLTNVDLFSFSILASYGIKSNARYQMNISILSDKNHILY